MIYSVLLLLANAAQAPSVPQDMLPVRNQEGRWSTISTTPVVVKETPTVTKTCHCSPQCCCGCNEGHQCSCQDGAMRAREQVIPMPVSLPGSVSYPVLTPLTGTTLPVYSMPSYYGGGTSYGGGGGC